MLENLLSLKSQTGLPLHIFKNEEETVIHVFCKSIIIIDNLNLLTQTIGSQELMKVYKIVF